MKFQWDNEYIKPAQTQEQMRSVMKAISTGRKKKNKGQKE